MALAAVLVAVEAAAVAAAFALAANWRIAVLMR
jgi:hypothetical protein